MKPKSERNKTLNTSVEDGKEYLSHCITVTEDISLNKIKNKTILGDTFSVCSLLPKESIDLVIADPPYNLAKTFGENKFSKMKADDYEAYTRLWLSLTAPLLKPNGSVYVCCDWKSSLTIGSVLSEFFIVRNRITWQREKGRGAKANWKNGLEDIWFATKSNTYTFNLDAVKIRKKVIAPYYEKDGKPRGWEQTEEGNFRFTCPSNFWDDITIPFWSMPENTAHPTQKPKTLIERLIFASSSDGNLVLDPFMGSGIVAVVCKEQNRGYVGFEIDQQYFEKVQTKLGGGNH